MYYFFIRLSEEFMCSQSLAWICFFGTMMTFFHGGCSMHGPFNSCLLLVNPSKFILGMYVCKLVFVLRFLPVGKRSGR